MSLIVLFGGSSDERHVSVASAQNVVRTLGAPIAWFWAPGGEVHDVAIDDLLSHKNPFQADFVPKRPAVWPDLEMALEALPVEDPMFCLALHGGAGENGTVQKMLEDRNLPFSGSGSTASSAAFDKGRAKAALRGKVRMADERLVDSPADVRGVIDGMLGNYERIVLKPVAGGSSRGLFFLSRGEDAGSVVDEITALNIPYIVEQFISGRELTVGIADMGEGPFALPVIEIEIDPGRQFDYVGKYLGKGTREICPAKIPESMAREAQQTALDAHIALGCEGYSRTDVIAAADGIYFLELNTLPGMTTSSLVPQELKEAKIDFRHFLETQVEMGKKRVGLPVRAARR
jgi:D-alanine-D-alanine ligase